jgi:hypothetical protein
MADWNREATVAKYLREIADVWHASIDRWMFVSGTNWCRRYGVDGYSFGSPQPRRRAADRVSRKRCMSKTSLPPKTIAEQVIW